MPLIVLLDNLINRRTAACPEPVINAGQRRRDDGRGKNIVKAADGIILRDVQPLFVQHRDHADGDHIVCPNKSRRTVLLRQQLPRQPCARRIFKRYASARAVLFPAVLRNKHLDRGFDAVLLSALVKALPESLQPLLPRQRRLTHRRRDKRCMPVAEVVKMVSQHCTRTLVAQFNGADRQLLALFTDQHQRNAR